MTGANNNKPNTTTATPGDSNSNSAAALALTAVTTTATTTEDETTAKGVHKRYEGLLMVRTKAIKGKGAWYWAHLEPILVHNSDTGLPKAVKLRCSLCDSVFSASNPSRTASEHLKRGTCPNFNLAPNPISSIPPSGPSPAQQSHFPGPTPPVPRQQNSRKRGSCFSGSNNDSCQVPEPVSSVVGDGVPRVEAGPTTSRSEGVYGRQKQGQQQQLVLSGGKEDLGALAMFEDSVKKLKSPKQTPGLKLSKQQVESAMEVFVEWAYECCGSLSFTCLEHPKLREFMCRVGLPPVVRRDLLGERLEAKYEEAKAESEAKIRDAMFFQVAADGWRKMKSCGVVEEEEENLVNLAFNLPNGTCVFRRAVLAAGYVNSKFAEEVLWETISDICGSNVQQCVGIVSDRFKSKALRNLENRCHWMVNLSCQFQGFHSLAKDLIKDVALFKNVVESCFKLACFVNDKSQIRNSFLKYQLQEYGHAGLLRVVAFSGFERMDFGTVYNMLGDILSSARALQFVLLDDSYKIACMEEPVARDVGEMMRNPHFWNELEAVHSLVKLIKGMAQEIELERPRVGQCLPLWEELRVKVGEWGSKFHIAGGAVERVIERRFKKNYHPAWAAAFILDPLYLIRDASGKYLPPFKCLTPEQEKDVDKLITRLVSRDEAHIALMELMKWRTEGLDPVYAQAVQLKQRDPITGKMKIANPQSSRLVWETYLSEFKLLGRVAVRLIFLHATSFGFKCNTSFLRWVSSNSHSRGGTDKAQKLIFIAAHSKLERRDFSHDEDKDAELFTMANGEDDVLNEVFVNASSV